MSDFLADAKWFAANADHWDELRMELLTLLNEAGRVGKLPALWNGTHLGTNIDASLNEVAGLIREDVLRDGVQSCYKMARNLEATCRDYLEAEAGANEDIHKLYSDAFGQEWPDE